MRLRKRLGTAGGGGRRLAALLMLLLVFHAVQAGAAHTHLAPNLSAQAADASPRVSDGGEGRDSREFNSHAQCPVCRLQRNLSSNLHNSAPVAIAPRTTRLRIETVVAAPGHTRPSRASAGRAPPLH
ncbi:MAG TPA: DUF2946 family protein [Pyrinomonadaceae bacterium]|nr:DUF2946 family protein [Pyrinomonadaceae bacterium]